jgi:predicted nucleic acid-binding protein
VIVYADTSALFKLVVAESGSTELRELRPSISILATVRIAFVEMRAALAAAMRDQRIVGDDLEKARRLLGFVWSNVSAMDVDETLVGDAANLAERFALRACDAVHLAGLARLGRPAEVTFACWDRELREPASRLGYPLHPATLG